MITIWKKILEYIVPSVALRSTVTVRFAFPLMFSLAAIIGLANIVSTSPSAITLELKSTVVGKGSDFQIDVFATTNVPVNAADIQISYDDAVVEVLGIDRGQSVITLWTTDPKAENGLITLTGGTYRKGFIGKHLIATINARAKSDGKTVFVVKKAELLAGDGKASVVATDSNGKATEVAITSTTESPAASATEAPNREISVYVVTDIDQDGKVSMADITTFMKNWFTKNSVYDFNNDGSMTINDFSILLSSYVAS